MQVYKDFIGVLLHRGGVEIGGLKAYTRKTFETGAQDFFNLSTFPSEVGACDEQYLANLQDSAHEIATAFTKAMPDVRRDISPILISSWPTANDDKGRPSSAVLAETFIVGPDHRFDLFLSCAEPGALSREGIFSTNFAPHELETAEARGLETIESHKINGGIALMDENTLAFRRIGGIHKVLIEKGYALVARTHRDEIRLYVFDDAAMYVFKPLCVGGCALDGRDKEICIERLHTTQCLRNICDFGCDVPVYRSNVSPNAAINDIAFFHFGHASLTFIPRHRAVLVREALSPDETYCCINNGLAKNQSPYISERSRTIWYRANNIEPPSNYELDGESSDIEGDGAVLVDSRVNGGGRVVSASTECFTFKKWN